MNSTLTETGAIATTEHAQNSSALMMSTDSMDKMMRMADMMSTSKATVPAHFRGSPGDCMAVVMQAAQWGMNPFAVAQKTHLVNGTLGYEAQLVAAVINSSRAVLDRFHFDWYGPWEKVIGKFTVKKSDKGEYRVPGWTLADEEGCGIRVWATLRGEADPRVLDLLLAQARVRNSTLWADDPKQQLAYLAQKRWSRLYAPDVILGVYTHDELVEHPAKDMGRADVVEPPAMPAGLLDGAREAAGKGKKAFAAWIKGRTEAERAALTPYRPECEAIWTKADAERTVQAPAPAAPAAAQAQDEITLDMVLGKLRAAANLDALDVALDWANALTDPAEVKQAEALYSERQAALGA